MISLYEKIMSSLTNDALEYRQGESRYKLSKADSGSIIFIYSYQNTSHTIGKITETDIFPDYNYNEDYIQKIVEMIISAASEGGHIYYKSSYKNSVMGLFKSRENAIKFFQESFEKKKLDRKEIIIGEKQGDYYLVTPYYKKG